MSPTKKTLKVVFGGMAVMVVTTVGGFMIGLGDGSGQYGNAFDAIFGGIIGAFVGVPIWGLLGYMVCRDINSAPHEVIPDISIHDAADAALAGNIEAVKQHLAAGTDVNAKDVFGMTPLHRATYQGYMEIAELLIAKGADVDAMNNDGQTPLDYAGDETAELLRKHGGKTSEELKAEGK